jgi:hypothetical protein
LSSAYLGLGQANGPKNIDHAVYYHSYVEIVLWFGYFIERGYAGAGKNSHKK